MCIEACSYVRSFEDLKGSAAECADQSCGFCKELNKTQFCGRKPYTGGEPRYIMCCGFCCAVVFPYALINIHLISKITAN